MPYKRAMFLIFERHRKAKLNGMLLHGTIIRHHKAYERTIKTNQLEVDSRPLRIFVVV